MGRKEGGIFYVQVPEFLCEGLQTGKTVGGQASRQAENSYEVHYWLLIRIFLVKSTQELNTIALAIPINSSEGG